MALASIDYSVRFYKMEFLASLSLLANLVRGVLREETYNQAAKSGGKKCR
jgi:hypothetical protein